MLQGKKLVIDKEKKVVSSNRLTINNLWIKIGKWNSSQDYKGNNDDIIKGQNNAGNKESKF